MVDRGRGVKNASAKRKGPPERPLFFVSADDAGQLSSASCAGPDWALPIAKGRSEI